MELTGKQRIAVLLLAMGDKFTADVFKRMDRQEIAEISKAIVELEPVPRETVEEVLREFHESLVEGVDMIAGGSDTYLGKGKAGTLDAKLSRLTKWVAAVFVLLTLFVALLGSL